MGRLSEAAKSLGCTVEDPGTLSYRNVRFTFNYVREDVVELVVEVGRFMDAERSREAGFGLPDLLDAIRAWKTLVQHGVFEDCTVLAHAYAEDQFEEKRKRLFERLGFEGCVKTF